MLIHYNLVVVAVFLHVVVFLNTVVLLVVPDKITNNPGRRVKGGRGSA